MSLVLFCVIWAFIGETFSTSMREIVWLAWLESLLESDPYIDIDDVVVHIDEVEDPCS